MKNLNEEEKKYISYKMKEFTDYLSGINKDFDKMLNKQDKEREKNK